MAFDTYEATLPAGARTTVGFNERRSDNTPPRQYIFVATSEEGGVAPDLQLQAGIGDPVSILSTVSAIFSGPGQTGDYVGDALLGFDWSGAILIQAFLYLAGPSTWKLTIVNRDTVTRHFAFVVSDNDQNPVLPTFGANPLSVNSGKPGDLITVYGDHFEQPGLEVDFAWSMVGPSLALARGHRTEAEAAGVTWVPGELVSFTGQQIQVKVPPVKGGSVLSVRTCWGRSLCPYNFFIKM